MTEYNVMVYFNLEFISAVKRLQLSSKFPLALPLGSYKKTNCMLWQVSIVSEHGSMNGSLAFVYICCFFLYLSTSNDLCIYDFYK